LTFSEEGEKRWPNLCCGLGERCQESCYSVGETRLFVSKASKRGEGTVDEVARLGGDLAIADADVLGLAPF